MAATQKDVKDRQSVDDIDIDIDTFPSDVKEVHEVEDDEYEEAPSERDSDAERNGETPQSDQYSHNNVSICQTPMVLGKSLCPLPAILVLRHCKLSFLRSRLQTKAGFAPHNKMKTKQRLMRMRVMRTM